MAGQGTACDTAPVGACGTAHGRRPCRCARCRLTASRSDLLALNVGARKGAMVMVSPVCGLRPCRAARRRVENVPNPAMVMVSPPARASAMAENTALTAEAASVQDRDASIETSNFTLDLSAIRCMCPDSDDVSVEAAEAAVSAPKAPELKPGRRHAHHGGIGRVGGGIAAPRPSQSRACAIDALGSSPDRFAQEALMLPRLFGYPLLFRVRVGGTQSVLQRFPSVVLYR